MFSDAGFGLPALRHMGRFNSHDYFYRPLSALGDGPMCNNRQDGSTRQREKIRIGIMSG